MMKLIAARSAFFAAAAVVLVCCASTLISALHEDEAGKYDWLLPRIGTPLHGALLLTSSRKLGVVATDASAIAGIRLTNGSLLWRRVLGTEEELAGVAIAAQDAKGDTSIVAALTTTGMVHLFRGKDGFPISTPISLKTESLRFIACFASGDDEKPLFHVVGTTINPADEKQEVSLYTIDPSSQFQVTPAFHLAVPGPVAGVALGSAAAKTEKHDAQEMFVLLQDGRSSWMRLQAGGLMREFAATGSAAAVLSVSGSKAARGVAVSEGVALSAIGGPIGGVAVAGAYVGDAVGRSTAVECKDTTVSVGGVAVSKLDCDAKRGGIDLLAMSRSGTDSVRALFTTRHDGAVHFVAVSTSKKEVTTQWTRHEGMAFPADVALESEKAVPRLVSGKKDFAIATSVYVLSRYGVLHRLESDGKGVAWTADLRVGMVDSHIGAGGGSSIKPKEDGTVVVTTVVGGKKHFFVVDGASGSFVATLPTDDLVKPTQVGKNFFDIDKSTGELVGYELSAATGERVDIWRARVAGKISNILAAHDPLAIASVEHYKAVPNRTSQTTEIRRRYPMANVIVVASHDAADTLSIIAFDALTGATLASARHTDCPPPVRIAVAEHTVLYAFYNRAKRRSYVAAWELFEHQTSVTLDSNMVSPALVATSMVAKRRQFHSATVRPPHVVSTLRYFPYGPIAVLGVTHTAQAIARKLVVVVLNNGEALSISLPALWGVPLKQPEPKTEQEALMLNSVVIGTFDRLTHTNRVMRPSLFRCAPTLLESTSRIVVAGLDVWYYPASAGKPFDRLDDEFNKKGLLLVLVGLPLATIVLRYFAVRRTVNAAWS